MHHMIFVTRKIQWSKRRRPHERNKFKTALMGGGGGRCDGDTIGPQHRMFNILAPSCFVSRLEIPQIALRKGEILIRNKGWPKI